MWAGSICKKKPLRKRLMDEGLLASTGHDQGRNTPIMEKQLQGQKRKVLHLKKSVFESPEVEVK